LPEDHEKAFEMYTNAADLGSIKGHHRLGECYMTGQGTSKDKQKMTRHLEIAAMKGDALARYKLGV
jgi:TPR repeat protein